MVRVAAIARHTAICIVNKIRTVGALDKIQATGKAILVYMAQYALEISISKV